MALKNELELNKQTKGGKGKKEKSKNQTEHWIQRLRKKERKKERKMYIKK